MKHSIRQRVINEYGLPVVKIETVHGELGSGFFDKNGQEIFEGNMVKVHSRIAPVIYTDKGFYLKGFLGIRDYPIRQIESKYIEVVGHVAEES